MNIDGNDAPMWAVKAASFCGIIDFIVSKHKTEAAALTDLEHQIRTAGANQISTRGANWFFRVEQIEATDNED